MKCFKEFLFKMFLEMSENNCWLNKIKKGNDRIENGKKKNEQAVNHDFTKR